MNSDDKLLGIFAVFALFIVVGGIGGCMWGYPQYKVYRQEMNGRASLAEANMDRQIAIAEAQAAQESATHLAEAEIIRARGVAEANEIIGESLRENEAYLRYLWIQGLHNGTGETIYVPTEANLPVLEATRRQGQ